MAVIAYLCDAAAGKLREGDTARAERFLSDAALELADVGEDVCKAELAAQQAEATAQQLRAYAEGLRRRTRRAARRIERLSVIGLRTPRVSEIRPLLAALTALALFFVGCASPATSADMPAVHFPIATYAGDVAGDELGALQGAMAALNSSCVPVPSEPNTAPLALFWGHYEPAPADTCTALVVRVGDVAGAGAELVARAGCVPALVVHPGASADDVADALAELAELAPCL